jgi:co-chaperonin GroES (HSP10)
MKVQGKIRPLRDNVIISDMEFGQERTKSGIYVPSADGKHTGITPRWGRVWAIGKEQKHVSIGQWVLVEHGRWTRTVEVEQGDDVIEVRMIDNNAIMCVSDDGPTDVVRAS